MEAALVSAATGALKPVIRKLATLLGDEYKRFKGLRKEIKSLTHELAAMDAFLMKMSAEEDPDMQDKVWMNEIKLFLGKMKTRRQIGKEIEDLKKQIIEVGERNARYMTHETFSKTLSASVDPRALVIFEHASKLVGIDGPKNEIIKLLKEEDGHVPTKPLLKIVSIVGSGGMGKTTLANQVYQELKGKFECRAFISVSQNPDMMNILRTILSKVGNQRYAETEEGSVQQLIINIKEYLLDKRYFIVVDDIWDVKTWDVIKATFPIGSFGSIIITTSRMKDVADSCRSSFSGHIYNIRPLNVMHAQQLFHGRLFNSKEDCRSHLKVVSDKILKKCDGLPLAIIAISGLLSISPQPRHAESPFCNYLEWQRLLTGTMVPCSA